MAITRCLSKHPHKIALCSSSTGHIGGHAAIVGGIRIVWDRPGPIMPAFQKAAEKESD